MCSRKWATPLVFSVSYLLPASIYRLTVQVGLAVSSVATRNLLLRVVTFVSGALSRDVLYLWLVDVDCRGVDVYL